MKKLLNSFLTLPSAASMQRYTLGLLGVAALALLVYITFILPTQTIDLRSLKHSAVIHSVQNVEMQKWETSSVTKPMQYIVLESSMSVSDGKVKVFKTPTFESSMTVLFLLLTALAFAGCVKLASDQMKKYLPVEKNTEDRE